MGKGRSGGQPRRHPGIRGRRPDLKATRQREASERNEKRAQLFEILKIKPGDKRSKWATSELELEVHR